jgi:soluble lytic murein transglycosylase-like protein
MARVQSPPRTPPTRIARLVARNARAHGVDPALLAAVVKAESGFDPRAESPVGARGLLQLMPARARAMGVDDPMDANASLDAGARCLAAGLCRFDGDLRLALAGLRLGPDAVERHGGVPAYSDMRAYLPKVMEYYDEFRAAGTFGRPAGPGNGSGATTDQEGRC